MASRLDLDCATAMANHLNSYKLSQLSRVSRFWTALNGERGLWARLLRGASSEVDQRLRRLAPRFLHSQTEPRSDRSAVASAYMCCRFMVRALREEYTNNFTVLHDAVRIFISQMETEELPSAFALADRARLAWGAFQSVITRIPLCSRWNAVEVVRSMWTEVRVLKRVIWFIRYSADCNARLCSMRANERKTYEFYAQELSRIVRRFVFVIQNTKVALSALSYEA